MRHVRPPWCCMKRFRFAYRGRLFTVSACRSRREAASFAVSALGCRPSIAEAALSLGQVRAIVDSFDLVYCDPAPSASTTILLQRRYGRGTLALRVPVCMFYYVTVAVEELWCSEEVRTGHLEIAALRARLRALAVPGDVHTPAFWACGQAWYPAAPLVAPVATFPAVAAALLALPGADRSGAPAFRRMWAFACRLLSGEDGVVQLHLRAHGRSHYLPVRLIDSIPAAAALDALAAAMPDTPDEFRPAWDILCRRWRAPPSMDIPAELRFGPGLTYDAAPAAWAPRPYPEDAPQMQVWPDPPRPPPPHYCCICGLSFNDHLAWTTHLQEHGGASGFRRQALALEGNSWPRGISGGRVRRAMWTSATNFTHLLGATDVCASCALEPPEISLTTCDLRPLSPALHGLLSGRAYLERHTSLYPEPVTSPHFVGLPWGVLQQAGVPVPSPFADPMVPDVWLLHLRPAHREAWDHNCARVELPLLVPLCSDCQRGLKAVPPRLPAPALANGNLALPPPQCLLDLSLAEQLFVSRGFTVRRLRTLPGPTAEADRQRALHGSTVSFPQSSGRVFEALPPPIADAAEWLTAAWLPRAFSLF